MIVIYRAWQTFKKNILAEGGVVLGPHQDSISSVRVRSDIEVFLHETPVAGAQAESCLNYRPPAHLKWPSL